LRFLRTLRACVALDENYA